MIKLCPDLLNLIMPQEIFVNILIKEKQQNGIYISKQFHNHKDLNINGTFSMSLKLFHMETIH